MELVAALFYLPAVGKFLMANGTVSIRLADRFGQVFVHTVQRVDEFLVVYEAAKKVGKCLVNGFENGNNVDVGEELGEMVGGFID